MKTKYLFTSLALAVPALMSAVPASPRLRPVTNPDGTVVEVRVHGDEFFHFMTDADCARILERDSHGFIVDAVRYGAPLKFNEADVELLRAEAYEENPVFTVANQSGMQKMATLSSEGRSNYPTLGVGNRSLVVLVEFEDTDFYVENPREYYTRQLNEPGFSDYNGVGSAVDYYKAASSGKYVPQFDVYGPVKVSGNASYYSNNNSGRMAGLIKESLTALHEEGEVDFSNYDLDEDGVIDTVFFYYAGYGQADSGTETIWPHQYDYRYYTNGGLLTFDGKRVGPYACANELDGYNPNTGRQPWNDGSEPWVGGIGTFVHEYGHVLGLPDLYDVEYSGKAVTPGEWDVMDSGSYNFNGVRPPLFSAYEQWVCRWLEYETAEDFTHYDLTALGHTDIPTAVRIRIPTSAAGNTFNTEYFVIETRDNSEWDACFPEPGLMVWRINYNKNLWTTNSVNSQRGSNVEIVYARNSKHPLFETGAIYNGADVELKPSKEYTYWKSPYITSIAYDKDSNIGSFDYNMITPPDVATVLHDNPLAAADGSRSFTLTWDPVEGVDAYLVTVHRTSNGQTINDFEDKNVGTDTSVVVGNLSTMYWRLEMEAYVKCIKDGMVSTSTSNRIIFKPSELELDATGAVDGIVTDISEVKGGVGCIYAPEGAEIYSASGARLRNENLAAGIYIVVCGGKSTKVVVR